MEIINIQQGSAEWAALRAGRITGSRMIDVMALTKPKFKLCAVKVGADGTEEIVAEVRRGSKKIVAAHEALGLVVKETMTEPPQPQKARLDYCNELAFERIAGVPQISKETIEMKWGRRCEEYARFAYEARTGIRVQRAGFCLMGNDFVGISPDGLVRDDGGIEIKSPFNGRIHVETWLHGMPEDHKHQVQACMWVTGRQWWDFVSFDPRVKKHLQLYIETIYRDDAYIANLASECDRMNQDVISIVRQCMAKNKAFSAKANNFETDGTGEVPQMPVPDLDKPNPFAEHGNHFERRTGGTE